MSLASLAIEQANRGKLDEAIALFERALQQDPHNPSLHNNLGMALYSAERFVSAIESYRQAVALCPSYALAHNNLGAALAAMSRHAEAIASFRAALDIEANSPDVLNNLGTSLYHLGRLNEAAQCLKKAIAGRKGFSEAEINIGHVLAEQNNPDGAILYYNSALEKIPNDATLLASLGKVLCEAGRHSEAVAHYEMSIALDAELVASHGGLATALLEMGLIDDARESFERAIRLEPDRPAHYLGLTRTMELSGDSPILKTLLAFEEKMDSLSVPDRIDAHFAIGKALADTGDRSRSFTHLIEGNRLKRKSIAYDEGRILSNLFGIQHVFSKDFMRIRNGCGISSPIPVFIIGMPRCGSTLVEQILSSHPKMFGAGEVDTLRQTLDARGLATKAYPAAVLDWSEEQLCGIAHEYIHRLQSKLHTSEIHGEPERIINKMLSNFQYLGLIHQIFPNSSIIHVKRDPIDTCLSSFSIQFAHLPFTFDLGELGRYYRAYAAVMDHWRSVLPPGRILEIQYEDLVRDVESVARQVVSHCGLEWDDACLRFYETKRAVRTASLRQVRQPIYQHSIGRWRPAAAILRPLLEGLEGAADIGSESRHPRAPSQG